MLMMVDVSATEQPDVLGEGESGDISTGGSGSGENSIDDDDGYGYGYDWTMIHNFTRCTLPVFKKTERV